ncbi:MAG TPA: DUF1822 family protein [Coleofasciculaceae cyanobacterium]
MRTDLSKSTSSHEEAFNLPTPQPGEIWEVHRLVRSPLTFSSQEQQNLYSDVAKQFLQGNSPPRYVMIITEPAIDTEEEWQIVSVMVLSGETQFLSDVDLLISSEISGLGQDLLAQTWHVLDMLACNLLQPIGQRLSREIYDLLLTVGDYYHGLVDEPPAISEIKRSQLRSCPVNASKQPEIQLFHAQEKAWSDVLSIPVAAYRTYSKAIALTNTLLDKAVNVERELAQTSNLTRHTRINLSQWFQRIAETQWQESETFWRLPELAIASRSSNASHNIHPNSDEITPLIQHLSSEDNEYQRRRAAKRLGEIAFGHSEAIEALVNLVQTTQDDETLWTGVESLWQIDPENPATGVRRVKPIDLGMHVADAAVALAVAIVQKCDQQIGVLLQLYPTSDDAYLPPDLKLILLEGSGQILHEVTARQADVCIQLKFSGQPGELFGVNVALGEVSITEEFVM